MFIKHLKEVFACKNKKNVIYRPNKAKLTKYIQGIK